MTGELPAGWVEANIPDVLAELKSGKIIDQGWSPRCEKHPSADETTWGALKTTAIQDGWFEPHHTKQLPEHLDPKPELEIESGDILLTCAGPRNRCGVVCKVPSVRRKLFISGKMYRFRAEGRVIEADFLEAVLRSPKLKRDIDKIKTGGSESGLNLTQSRFKGLSIPLPPLAEQRRIVRELDRLSAHTTTARTHLTALKTLVERYKKVVRRQAFEGIDRRAPLVDFCREGPTNGWSPKASTNGRGTLSLKLSATSSGVMKLNPECIKKLSVNVPENSKYWLEPGDILIQRANSLVFLGTAAIYDGPARKFIYPDLMMRIRVNSDTDERYLWHFLSSPSARSYFVRNATGTAGNMPKINGRVVKSLGVPLVSLEEQREIVRRIDAAFARIDLLAAEAERALKLVGHLDQRILERAFSGGLVSQNPDDEPAATLLARIKATRAATPPKKRRRRVKV